MYRHIFLTLVVTLGVFGSSSLAFAADDTQTIEKQAEKVPVVYITGLGGDGSEIEKLRDLPEIFDQAGFKFLVAKKAKDGRLQVQSDSAHESIRQLVPTGRFHIIGKSMGGIIARDLIFRHPEFYSGRVISLITLAAPHHGTPVADKALESNGGGMDALGSLFGGATGGLKEAAQDITTYAMKDFNEKVKDDPSIRYESFGATIPEPIQRHTFSMLVWYTHKLIKDATGEANDGLVPTQSAEWGHYVSTIEGDHFSITAQKLYDGGFIYKDVFKVLAEHLKTVK